MARYALKIEGEKELIKKFKRLGEKAVGVVDRATLEGVTMAQGIADSLAPEPCVDFEPDVKNKRLGRSVYIMGVSKEKWYLVFFETGTQPHEIAPIHRLSRLKGKMPKMALSWEEGGQWITAGSVNHPGMAAQPFLRPAIEDNQKMILKKMGDRFRIELNSEIESSE